MGWRAHVIGMLAFALGCTSPERFVCQADLQCSDGSLQGRCEPSGYCSWPDSNCPSQWRYGDYAAGSFSGACVSEEAPPATGTSSGTTAASSLADSAGSAGVPEDWWDAAWTQRVRLTAEAPELDERLIDVPVLVVLSADRIEYEAAAADGADLRFVADDGTTVLPHEIDGWLPGSTSLVWVTLPTIGGGETSIWIYYGNADAASTSDGPRVWTNGYAAVWHMGADHRDSTGLAPEGVNTGAVASDGRLGQATEFDAVSSEVLIGDLPALRELFVGGATISAWINPSGWGGTEGNWGRIVDKMAAPNDAEGYSTMVTNAGRFRFVQGYADGEMGWETQDGTVQLDQWTYVAVSHDAAAAPAQPRIFLDGAEVQTIADADTPGVPGSDEGTPLIIGSRVGLENRTFQGLIDEVRIATIERSPGWHATQTLSMSDGLWTWGNPESLP